MGKQHLSLWNVCQERQDRTCFLWIQNLQIAYTLYKSLSQRSVSWIGCKYYSERHKKEKTKLFGLVSRTQQLLTWRVPLSFEMGAIKCLSFESSAQKVNQSIKQSTNQSVSHDLFTDPRHHPCPAMQARYLAPPPRSRWLITLLHWQPYWYYETGACSTGPVQPESAIERARYSMRTPCHSRDPSSEGQSWTLPRVSASSLWRYTTLISIFLFHFEK